MTQAAEHYISYLVRLWPITDGGKLVWRASVESPGTPKRRGFPDLSALCAFLETEVRQVAERGAVQNANCTPLSRPSQTAQGNGCLSEENQPKDLDRQLQQGA